MLRTYYSIKTSTAKLNLIKNEYVNEGGSKENCIYPLPINAASSPNKGINMHGLRFPRLSDQPPAKRIITIPNTESEIYRKKKNNSNESIKETIFF